MKKLWQKQWTLDRDVETFETGDDILLDQKLVWADAAGSIAHSAMLCRIGILSVKEAAYAKKGLCQILKLASKGKWILTAGDEDVHTKIENTLTAWYGSVGKKIHTGRSRNDQVATAIRLYTKAQLCVILKDIYQLADAFVAFAKEYEFVLMPGYTHTQKAMPSSVGMWAGSFAEGLIDCAKTLSYIYELNDQSPLGSAAGYGVPLPLDRVYSAKLLGFSKVQNNSLYCQNARGVIEGQVVAACVSVLQLLSKFSSDVLLFTTGDLSYFSVDDSVCTGSSIMPQKKNVDIAELIRSKVHVVAGHYQAIIGISSGTISGYNRDLQDTKKPLMESLETTGATVHAAKILLSHLTPDINTCAESVTPDMLAAHNAFALVSDGLPFRDAYHAVSTGHAAMQAAPSGNILSSSVHTGGTGNLGLSKLKHMIATAYSQCLSDEKKFTASLRRLGVDPVPTG